MLKKIIYKFVKFQIINLQSGESEGVKTLKYPKFKLLKFSCTYGLHASLLPTSKWWVKGLSYLTLIGNQSSRRITLNSEPVVESAIVKKKYIKLYLSLEANSAQGVSKLKPLNNLQVVCDNYNTSLSQNYGCHCHLWQRM